MPAGGGSCECGLRGPIIPLSEIDQFENFDRGLYIQKNWREIIQWELDPFISLLSDSYRLREVTAFINNVCNLKCKHCYIAYTASKPLSEKKWLMILDEVFQEEIQQFGIVGTEPLLTPEILLKTLRHCAKHKEKNPKFRFGLISNLTNLTPQIAEEICEIGPSFFNISLDGTQGVHDAVRGEGNFRKTWDNLNLLRKYYSTPKYIFLLTTWSTLTCRNYPSFVSKVAETGLKQFVVSPYISHQADENLSITIATLLRTIEDTCHEIESRHLQDVNVCIKLDYMSIRAIYALIQKGFIDQNDLVTDDTRRLFYIKQLSNNSKFVYILYPVPENYWKAVRIGPDGRISGCSEMFAPDYKQRSMSLFEYPDLQSACTTALNNWIGRTFYADYLSRQRHILFEPFETIKVDDIIMASPNKEMAFY